jgi:hypothetical protein
MREEEFWGFLEAEWRKGRIQMRSGGIGDFAGREYLEGHALLPRDYDNLSEETIVRMGGLLFQKEVAPRTKQAVMMLLAHQPSETALTILARYNISAEAELACFAQMALEDCAMWND